MISFARWCVAGTAARLVLGLVAAGDLLAQAQSENPAPAFEVVSVKSSGSTRIPQTAAHGFHLTPGRLTCNQALINFITSAYSVNKPWQVIGPDWIQYEKYQFEAVMPQETSKATVRLMLRTMLADRFGLRLHQESREMAVYALVVARGGPKLRPATDLSNLDGMSGGGIFKAAAITMDALADDLAAIAERPVIDKTGLTGRYNIDMTWTADYENSTSHFGRRDIGLLTAIEDQLGLKLEPGRMQLDVWVIDHVNKIPTPN